MPASAKRSFQTNGAGEPDDPKSPGADTGDLRALIRQTHLTAAEWRLATVVLDRYPQSALLTATKLAATAGVSAASVSRFATKLGYGSFAELQDRLREDLRATLGTPSARLRARPQREHAPYALLEDAIETDIENLRRTLELINRDVFDGLVARLARSDGRVYIAGPKKGRVLAEYLAIQLNQIHGGVTLLKMNDTLPDSLLDVASRALLVVLQPRRVTAQIVHTIERFQAASAAVAVLTDELPPPVLTRVEFPIRVVSRGISAFDSYAAYVAVINAIVAALLARAPARARVRLDHLENLNAAFGAWYDGESARPADGG